MTKSGNDTRHPQSCILYNRLYAVLAMLFSVGMSLSSWHDIGRPFSGVPQPFRMIFGLPVIAAVAVYLFFTIRCVWERLWLGPVAVDSLILVVKAFEPQLVLNIVGVLKIVSLALWIMSLAISMNFVRSAFRGGKSHHPPPTSTPSDLKEIRPHHNTWALIVLGTYPFVLAFIVVFVGLPLDSRAYTILLLCATLVYSCLVFASSVHWARAAHDRPQLGALRLALGTLLSLEILGLVAMFSGIAGGVVSPAVIYKPSALWITLAATLGSVIVYLTARHYLQSRRNL